MAKPSNLANYLVSGCKRNPDSTALLIPIVENGRLVKEESISFFDLLNLVASFQAGLKAEGFVDGDRIIFMMRPSIELYAMLIACFCSGIVPVFVDTGMGRQKILMAVEDSNATAICAPAELLRLFWVIKPLWGLKRYSTDASVLFCKKTDALKKAAKMENLSIVDKKGTDHCLITFTSGSTGRPKGADRTHSCLISQHIALQEAIPFQDGDVSLSCFPVAALHQLGCGVTTVLPRADLASIGFYDPHLVFRQIQSCGVSMLGTAPAFLSVLVEYLARNELQVNSIRKVVVGGSTVSTALAKNTQLAFPNAEITVIYGSTESEPISLIGSDELIALDGDEGFLVGKPVPACEVKVINLSNKGILLESDVESLEAQSYQVGELIVAGDHVLKEYIDNHEATEKTKIKCSDGRVWHRTGDVGFFDSDGRIWLVGRDKDIITTEKGSIFNYSVEKKLDQLDSIVRSAVLNVTGEICVVLQCDTVSKEKCFKNMLSEVNRIIPEFEHVLIIDQMPVDGRHNSKVDRQKLKEKINNNELDEINVTTKLVEKVNSGNNDGLVSEWSSWQRQASLLFLAIVVFYTLVSTQESIFDAIYLIASVVYIQIPLIFGGVVHMLVVSKDKFPILKIPINEKLFGANKTWRGMVVVPGFSLLGAVVLYPIEWIQSVLFGVTLSQGISLFVLSLIGGIGYVLGELPNSYLKRRLGVAPGQTSEKHGHLFVALDQVDSGVGVFILYWLILGMSLHYCLVYLCFFPVVALVVKYYLYRFKLKDAAR